MEKEENQKSDSGENIEIEENNNSNKTFENKDLNQKIKLKS